MRRHSEMFVLISAILLGFLNPSDALGPHYYTAGVFEHRPRANISDKTPEEIKAINLRFYEKAAVVAATKGVDILVFNEFGLFPYENNRTLLRQYAEKTPDPKKVVFNPCTQRTFDRPALYAMSCMARENGIYIVANVGDVHKCDDTCDADGLDKCGPKCPQDGVYLFNTNVVFDREGTLIARYHKMNVYFENLNMEEEDMFVTFKTEFGTFGLIVCFDSVFEFSYKLAHKHGIDTLIFPTYWFDDIVPLKGVEWQQAWALGNGVNFLAANTHTPGTGSLGSGIYSKEDGALVYTYEPDGESKLLVANIKINDSNKKVPVKSSITIVTNYGIKPKVEETGNEFPEYCYDKTEMGPKNEAGSMGKRTEDVFTNYRCFKSQTDGYSLEKLEKPSGKVELCNNGFCCSLSYSAKSMDENYYLAVRSGLNNVRNYYQWWEEVCMLIRCESFKGQDCFIQISKSKTVFNSVTMKARFKSNAVYPAVSKDKFRLASKSEWNVRKSDDETSLIFRSTSEEPLLKVALFGRLYEQDPPYIPFHKY